MWRRSATQLGRSGSSLASPFSASPVTNGPAASCTTKCNGVLSAIPNSDRASYMTPSIPFEQQLTQMKNFQKKRFLKHPWFERLSHVGSLSDDMRVLTFIAGNTAAGNLTDVARDWCYLDPSLHAAGAEAILQNMIFAGVPKVLNSLTTVAEMGIESRSVVEKDFNPSTDPPGYDEFTKAGETMQKEIFINKYPRLRDKMQFLHPALDKWMTDFSYGRIRNRPGLDSKMRQLCALASLSGDVVWPQFRSSIIGCLNCGATLEEVRAVLDTTQLIWGNRSQAMVDALWSDLNKRSLQRWKDPHVAEFSPSLSQLFDTKPTVYKEGTSTGFQTAEHHPWIYVTSKHDPLPLPLRILALLAAHTASGNLTRISIDWSYLPEDYHGAGLEVILQTAIFGGFQKTINALETVHNVGVSPSAINVEAELKAESRETVIKNGTNLLQLIYQKQYTRLREKMRWMHPDIDKLIVEFPYGRILARPCDKLTAKERELCSLACLAGQIVFPQMHSHILGALNTGASMQEIRGIFDQTEYVWGRANQAMVDGFWLDFEEHYKYKQWLKKNGTAHPGAAKGGSDD